MSTTQPQEGAPRQPATITVVQTLLILSAVGSAVGLIVSIYVVGVVLDVLARFQSAFSPFGAGSAQQPSLGDAGSSPQLTISIVLAVIETIAVIVVSIWAFRAVGRAQAVARIVLAVLAGAQLVLSVATTVAAGVGVGLVIVAALVGLLVFDVPVLFLLFVPAESRRWFSSPVAASGPQGTAARGPGAWASQPSYGGPPTPTGPPRSGPFPAAGPSGPFGPPQTRGAHGPRAGGGRHSAPRPPQD